MNYKYLYGIKLKKPLLKMDKNELIEHIKQYRTSWENMTSRDQDLSDEYLNTWSIKELRNKIKWYNGPICKKNAEGWLKNKSVGFLNTFKNFFNKSNNNKSNNNKSNKNNNKCVRQTKKKYNKRKSPPYPANNCKGKSMKGKDNLLYKSVSNKKGIYRWLKV